MITLTCVLDLSCVKYKTGCVTHHDNSDVCSRFVLCKTVARQKVDSDVKSTTDSDTHSWRHKVSFEAFFTILSDTRNYRSRHLPARNQVEIILLCASKPLDKSLEIEDNA